jgi:hypothetical protein
VHAKFLFLSTQVVKKIRELLRRIRATILQQGGFKFSRYVMSKDCGRVVQNGSLQAGSASAGHRNEIRF